MSGSASRTVVVERDDLEELVTLVEELSAVYDDGVAGTRPLEEHEARLLDRVRRGLA